MSFIDNNIIYDLIENLIYDTWPLIQSVNDGLESLNLPFLRMDYLDAMVFYGTDKPDVRFDLKLFKSKMKNFVGFHIPKHYVSMIIIYTFYIKFFRSFMFWLAQAF